MHTLSFSKHVEILCRHGVYLKESSLLGSDCTQSAMKILTFQKGISKFYRKEGHHIPKDNTLLKESLHSSTNPLDKKYNTLRQNCPLL